MRLRGEKTGQAREGKGSFCTAGGLHIAPLILDYGASIYDVHTERGRVNHEMQQI